MILKVHVYAIPDMFIDNKSKKKIYSFSDPPDAGTQKISLWDENIFDLTPALDHSIEELSIDI